MDFQSLTRRELQTLCKKNKIPANITNIAMADALKALEIVEGLEELSKPSESDAARSSIKSPEKMTTTSPTVPRTGCRTSTRRNLIKEEPESSQPLTRTRRGTRRTLAAEVEETKNGVPETPAASSRRKREPAASVRRKMEAELNDSEEDQKKEVKLLQKMKDVSKTPAAPSGRRRATTASSCRKMETDLRAEKEHVNNRGLKEESSVRRVHSTRRSVRLSEKKMAESNPKENEKTKAIKIDLITMEIPNDLKGNSTEVLDDLGKVSESTQMSGVDCPETSEEGSERINSSKVLSDQKWNVLPENGKDFGYDLEGDGHHVEDWKAMRAESEVYDEMDVVWVSDEQLKNLNIDEDTVVEDGVHDESKADDSLNISEAAITEQCEESDSIWGDNLEKTLDMKDEVLQHKGSDATAVDKLPSYIENSAEVLIVENEKESKTDKDLALEDSAAALATAVNVLNLTASATIQDGKQDIELGLTSEEECNRKASSDDEETTDQVQNQEIESGLASDEESNSSKHSRDDEETTDQVHIEEECNRKASGDDEETTDQVHIEEECNRKACSDDEETTDQVQNQEIESGLASDEESNSSKHSREETTDQVQNQEIEAGLASDEESNSSKHSRDDEETTDQVQNQEIEAGLASDEESNSSKHSCDDEETTDQVHIEEECNKKASSDDEETTDQVQNQEIESGLASDEESNSSKHSRDDEETTDLDYIELKVASEEEFNGPELKVASEEEFNGSELKVAFGSDLEIDPELYGIQDLESKLADVVKAHLDSPEHDSKLLDGEKEPKAPHILNFEESKKSFCHAEDPTLNMDKPKSWVDVYEVPLQESNGTDSGLVASVTPRKKSSSKKTPARRMIHVLDDNKENMNNGHKLDLTRVEGKKNNNTSKDNHQLKKLNGLSIRQLSKMLKEKLQITNNTNNNEEKNVAKMMHAERALQTLSENRLADQHKREN